MRKDRRWLGRFALALAVAVLVVGAFAVGVLVGEIRGARRVLGGEPTQPSRSPEGAPLEHPWPLGPPHGWREHPGRYGVLGIVEAVEEGAIVVTDRWDNRVRITVAEGTIFKRGRQRIARTELHVGDRIAVIGRPRGEGEIEARVIWIIPQDSRYWGDWYPHSVGDRCPWGSFEGDV
jgi:hypothetical protein